MWEEKTEETKYIDYFLRITETDLLTQEETESFFYCESNDLEPNTFIDKGSNGEVDASFWTVTTKELFESIPTEKLRTVTYTPAADEEEQILKVWAFYFSERDGERTYRKRTVGTCASCKFFKANIDDAIKREQEKDIAGTGDETNLDNPSSPDTDGNDVPSGNADDSTGTGEDSSSGNAGNESSGENASTGTVNPSGTKPAGELDKSQAAKAETCYFIPHSPHRMHRCNYLNCISVIKNGFCTKFKDVDYVTGQEFNTPCDRHNRHGECLEYELYEPEAIEGSPSSTDTESNNNSGNAQGNEESSSTEDNASGESNP